MKLKRVGKQTGLLWASAIDLLIDSVLATIWFTLVVTLLSVGVGTILVFGIGTVLIILAVELTRISGWVERHRTASIYQIEIAAPVRRQTKRTDGWRWLTQAFTDVVDPVTWRILLHHLFSMVIGTLMVAIWTFGIRLFILTHGTGLVWLAGLGGAAVLLAYVYAAGLLDRAVSPMLLGPSAKSALQRKVENLTDARQGAVDAASTERERIERNLHDGVQPQLVSVALNLGMARAKIDTDPDAAKALLEQAHTEAKASIADLRQLARGIHPSVLTDRGLDAALSAVASRCSVPTRISVELTKPASAEAEAVIYFAVAEALTNVSKHSAADSCIVTVRQIDAGTKKCRLVATVEDDGVGGANPGEGLGRGGLAGMNDRVRASGGTLLIESPTGGPTVITVELPCKS